MSEKANYFKIGLFFVVSVILIVTAIIVWGAGLLTKDKIYFETYFDSSVSGLDPGASVELMGVKIGQVESIDFASSIYDISTGPETVSTYERYIRIVCSISSEESEERIGHITDEQREARTRNLIQQGLRLRLVSNILTGQAILEGTFLDPKRFPVLDITWKPKYMYVPSAPGGISTMKDSVDKILLKLQNIDTERIGRLVEQILASLAQAVDDANLPEVSRGVQNLIDSANQAVEDVNVSAMSSELKGLFAEARETNQHLKKLLASEKPRPQSPNIAELIARLSTTLRRIDKLVSTQTPQIEQALEDLRKVSANLKELTENLKKHPAELIFSQPPPKSEAPK